MNNDEYKEKYERLTAAIESLMVDLCGNQYGDCALTRDQVYDRLHEAIYHDQWETDDRKIQ